MEKRLTEIDYLRALACLAVIVVHISAGYLFLGTTGELTRIMLLFLNRALIFVVPAFLFITGLVLTYLYQKREFNYFPFLKRRLGGVLFPYFFWAIIFYTFFISQGIYGFSLSFFLKKLLYGDLVYHFYFVILIVQFYLLFPLLRGLLQKYNSFLMLVIFLLGNVLFMKYIYFPYVDRFFLQYLCFFVFGCYFALNYQKTKKKVYRLRFPITVLYLLLSILLADQFYRYEFLHEAGSGFAANVLWLIFSLGAILFYYNLAHTLADSNLVRLKKFLGFVGDNSYYFYLSHPLFLMLTQKVITFRLIPSTTLNFLVTLFLVTGAVLLTAFPYQKVKRKLFFG